MSEKIIKKKIKSLRVWSDNPRYGYGSVPMDEPTAINTLIDVVGDNKMFALAKDIVESGGLLGNTLPTVVEEGGEFLVFDGNRRISTIKTLFDPSIIESDSYRAKIEKLVENKDLSALESVNVLLTDAENALRIMDGTHTGERGGAGLIPWDAYNRDISLSSRGRPVLYPASFAISKLLGLKTKKDFSSLQYTDYQRLFSSNALKAEFGISALDEAHKNNIENAITALRAYKDFKKFPSFSREFNTTKDEGNSSDQPISRFIAWHKRLLDQSASLSVKFENLTLFEGDVVPDINERIRVVKRADKSIVNLDPALLEVSFVNPVGKSCKDIDNRLIGDWKCKIIYDGCSAEGIISVKKLEDPLIIFGISSVQEGSSLSLKKCVSSATSSRRNSMIDSMSIEYRGNREPSIYNDVLTGATKAGTYTFSFTFNNDGTPYSINHEIRVVPIPDIKPGPVSSPASPFTDILHIGRFTKLIGIARIAEEINEVWQEGKYELAVCGMRAILELTLDEVSASSRLVIPSSSNLRTRLDSFKTELLNADNHVLSNALRPHNHLSYLTEINYLTTFDSNNLVSKLHLAAHKSSTYLNIESIFEACNKDLSHVISLAELVLR